MASTFALFVGACASDIHEWPTKPAPPLEVESARVAYAALLADPRCRPCMIEAPQYCAKLREFPLVAAVSGARLVKDFSTCKHEKAPPTPNHSWPCLHGIALRFDAVDTVSGGRANPTDVFRAIYTHDYWTPEDAEGVSLSAGERYLVFAYPGGNATPKADWDIRMACSY
jgi:hypothetical protein